MRFITILFIFLLIFVSFVFSDTKKYKISRGEQLVNSTLVNTATIIKEKFYLMPCGMGAAMPGGPIQKLTLCFSSNNQLKKEQLRILLIKSANELVDQVFKNEEIKQFLKDPIFNINNVQIIIYNHDKKGRTIYDPEILTAEISRGILTYETVELQPDNYFKSKNKFTETYDEALKAIQKT